jgi:hypothetical protein
MPGPGTSFLGGPIFAGSLPTQADFGSVILEQNVVLTQAGASTVSGTILLPASAQILDIVIDTTVVWNSGTSDTLSVGTVAGGTQYASGVDVKTAAGRQRPTFTAAQLTNMLNIGANTAAVVTVTPAGTTATTGSTSVSFHYQMNVQNALGVT